MKNLKSFSFVLLAVVFSSTSMFAGIEPDRLDIEKTALRSEIVNLLQDLNLDESEILASLSFTVSNKNRIEAVTVECQNTTVCQKIKNRLENRKVGVKMSIPDQTYYLDVIFRLE